MRTEISLSRFWSVSCVGSRRFFFFALCFRFICPSRPEAFPVVTGSVFPFHVSPDISSVAAVNRMHSTRRGEPRIQGREGGVPPGPYLSPAAGLTLPFSLRPAVFQSLYFFLDQNREATRLESLQLYHVTLAVAFRQRHKHNIPSSSPAVLCCEQRAPLYAVW